MSKRHDAKVQREQGEILAELEKEIEAVRHEPKKLQHLGTAIHAAVQQLKGVCGSFRHSHSLPTEALKSMRCEVEAADRQVRAEELLEKINNASSTSEMVRAFNPLDELGWNSFEQFRTEHGVDVDALKRNMRERLTKTFVDLWERCLSEEDDYRAFKQLGSHIAVESSELSPPGIAERSCLRAAGYNPSTWNDQVVRYIPNPDRTYFDESEYDLTPRGVLLRTAYALHDRDDLTEVMMLLALCDASKYAEVVGSLRQDLAMLAADLRARA